MNEPSKPASISEVVSGPISALPTLLGRKAGTPPQPSAAKVRTASKAPGARPAWPHAARSLTEPQSSFQKSSSEMM